MLANTQLLRRFLNVMRPLNNTIYAFQAFCLSTMVCIVVSKISFNHKSEWNHRKNHPLSCLPFLPLSWKWQINHPKWKKITKIRDASIFHYYVRKGISYHFYSSVSSNFSQAFFQNYPNLSPTVSPFRRSVFTGIDAAMAGFHRITLGALLIQRLRKRLRRITTPVTPMAAPKTWGECYWVF